MKFWKPAILTTLLFFAFTTIIVFTACERNICDNVNCFNGGSCNQGLCVCPIGYEDPQCGSLAVTRYIGTYVGLTTCDMLAGVLDSAVVTQGSNGILSVNVKLKSVNPKIVQGFVNSTVTIYSIIVTNNDSTQTVPDTASYNRDFTITLQNNKKLSINIYEHSQSPTDTFTHHCNFLGNKVSN
jgi:hypothetical protein